MIDLPTLAVLLSGGGILVTGLLATAFLRDPIRGMAQTTHRAESLPRVMADRYVAFTALAAGATLYRDLAVIAFLFAVFAFMSYADTAIYARDGHPYVKHLIAGLAATAVTGVALAAILKSGVAA